MTTNTIVQRPYIDKRSYRHLVASLGGVCDCDYRTRKPDGPGQEVVRHVPCAVRAGVRVWWDWAEPWVPECMVPQSKDGCVPLTQDLGQLLVRWGV